MPRRSLRPHRLPSPMQLNVFAAYTPFHIWVSQLIRDEYYHRSSDYSNALFVFNTSITPDWVDGKWDHIEAFGATVTPSGGPDTSVARVTTQAKKARAAARAVNRFHMLSRAFDKVRLHYAHLEEYFTNYLFFTSPRALEHYLIPDGALNFYPFRVTLGRVPLHGAKAAMAALAGIRFRPFFGLVTGADRKRLIRQFGFASPGLIHPEKLNPLHSPSLAPHTPAPSPRVPPSCIVLGQEDYARRIGENEYRRVVSAAVGYAQKAVPSLRLIYKPHHFGPDMTPSVRARFPNVDVLLDRRPVEAIVGTENVQVLVSVHSSALLHAKLLFGPTIRSIAVGFDEVAQMLGRTRSQQLAVLRTCYERCGVEFVDDRSQLS